MLCRNGFLRITLIPSLWSMLQFKYCHDPSAPLSTAFVTRLLGSSWTGICCVKSPYINQTIKIGKSECPGPYTSVQFIQSCKLKCHEHLIKILIAWLVLYINWYCYIFMVFILLICVCCGAWSAAAGKVDAPAQHRNHTSPA